MFHEGNGGTGFLLFGNPPTEMAGLFLGSSAHKASKTLLGLLGSPSTSTDQSTTGLKELLTNRFGEWLKKKNNPLVGEEVLAVSGVMDSWEEEEFNFEESITRNWVLH
jgi:hypothetical protein